MILSDLKTGDVKFGTSGARGLVSDLTPQVCYAFTQAFLRSTSSGGNYVYIGHDLRPSSPSIAQFCIQAIMDSGFKPVYVGEVPTPALALRCIKACAKGIMITGSHIPFDRNGLKFYTADGEILKEDEVAIMATEIFLPEKYYPTPLPPIDASCKSDYENRYVNWFGHGVLSGMKIGVYEHSSVAREPLKMILSQLGANVVSLLPSNDFIPIDTEAFRKEDVDAGIQWAEQFGFDAICSTDGDGDRPMFADETGKWLRGDLIGVLCAKYIGANAICTPVSSNTAVEKTNFFKVVTRTKIGSPYVIEAMNALLMSVENIVVGYEANGGFLLGSQLIEGDAVLDKLPTRDALLPMLTLLVEANKTSSPVSNLFTHLPSRYTSSDRLQNINMSSVKSLFFELASDLSLAGDFLVGDQKAVCDLNLTDGLRFTMCDGSVLHLRPSGNAPELRCYTEADTENEANQLCQNSLSKLSLRLCR